MGRLVEPGTLARISRFIFLFLGPVLGHNAVSAADRYEAEAAIVDENAVEKTADADASGGYYVKMKEGDLAFKVSVADAGYYTLWVNYSQPNDAGGKIQNLSVNGNSTGQISFPFREDFFLIKGSAKVKLRSGENILAIVKSWGWVNIDYIEITPFIDTPFSVSGTLVTPGASENAVKLYAFLRENFRKKIISGVMTNTVFLNDGKYTPYATEQQTEVAWIKAASGKAPALLGFDFLHATGLNSDQQWHQGYTQATLSMAENLFREGGIPAYCWHWMDPSRQVEAFYTASSNNTPYTDFNLNKAFKDTVTYAEFDPQSAEYQAIIRDIDSVAGHLKILADKGVPVLWRPLHEASGKWFWWGYRGPGACKALWKLLFDRLTKTQGLRNLIWVWTTDEAGDALDWYPGDEYVDIVGRDYYYYPRIANHGSLVASFEKVKELFGGRKLLALSENGSVPHPDSLVADGAGWSYFMPWYGDYAMDGWAHDNTAADWQAVMNHDYVVTLDEMPGWENFTPTALPGRSERPGRNAFSAFYRQGAIEFHADEASIESIALYDLSGKLRLRWKPGAEGMSGYRRLPTGPLPPGIYGLSVQLPREIKAPLIRILATGN